MKLNKLYLLLAILSFALLSCNDDDDDVTTSFNIDGVSYNLLETGEETPITYRNSNFFSDDSLSRTSIFITGVTEDFNIASVSFDLFRRIGEEISGTYTIHQTDDDNDDWILDLAKEDGRAISGWTSQIFLFDQETEETTIANNPSGTLEITLHDDETMSVKFDGTSFNTYDMNFEVDHMFTLEMDIRAAAAEE